jgi:hypothetical protein
MIDLTGVPEIDKETLLEKEELYENSPSVIAFKRIKENAPAYPTILLEDLGAYIGEDWAKQSKPNFRGWLGGIGGRFDIDRPEAITTGIDLSDIGYIGIWRGRTASKTHAIYCVLPSMNYGEVEAGRIIDLGSDVVRIDWEQEELDAMVKQGYDIMVEMIAEHGEYNA